jgi:spermidine synthase
METTPETLSETIPASYPRPWHFALIVFVSSACMMILELVAGRIIAPYVGVSLYTWTSVIGVILAGMSLGNYLGGKLADRRGSWRLLGVLFLAAGLLSTGVLLVDILGIRLPDGWPIVLRILVLTAALFFLPSTLLGMISPVVTKLAVRDLAKTGSTVGRISASGTVGSIVGTFATGFVLISWFGTHMIVWGVSIILFAMAAIFLIGGSRRGRVELGILAVGILAAASALVYTQGWLKSPCSLETNYFCIKVRDSENAGRPVRILILDRLVHSYSSLDDPRQLVYGYEKAYAELTSYKARQHPDMSALFIGGGGYTFPRYMEAIYPDSQLDVIEIDPGVTQTAYKLLGLKPDTRVVTYNEDARMFLEREPDRQYDLVMGDAFNDYSVPYHLTTKEFNDRVRAWLAADGFYMVNLIDGPRRDFLRAYVNTLRQTFDYVYVVPAVRGWRESPRITFVIVASQAPIDLSQFDNIDAGDGERLIASMALSQSEVDGILAEGKLALLTDRFAPVDQLLAPVVRGEAAPAVQPVQQPTTAPQPGGKPE